MAEEVSLAEAPLRGEPRWIAAIHGSALVVAGVALAAMAAVTIADVASREARGHGISGTLEIVSYWFMPVLVFMSIAAADRADEHIRVGLLTERLQGRTRRVADSVTSLALVGVLLWMLPLGWHAAEESRLIEETAPVHRWLVIWPVRYVIVLGLALYALSVVVRTITSWRATTSEVSES